MKRRRGTEGDATSGLSCTSSDSWPVPARACGCARPKNSCGSQRTARPTPGNTRRVARAAPRGRGRCRGGHARTVAALDRAWHIASTRGRRRLGTPGREPLARDQRSVERRPASPAARRAPRVQAARGHDSGPPDESPRAGRPPRAGPVAGQLPRRAVGPIPAPARLGAFRAAARLGAGLPERQGPPGALRGHTGSRARRGTPSASRIAAPARRTFAGAEPTGRWT
jgi:hypothetical protein